MAQEDKKVPKSPGEGIHGGLDEKLKAKPVAGAKKRSWRGIRALHCTKGRAWAYGPAGVQRGVRRTITEWKRLRQ